MIHLWESASSCWLLPISPVASVGGFLGRKSDGLLGTMVLWRGLQQLRAPSRITGILGLIFASNLVATIERIRRRRGTYVEEFAIRNATNNPEHFVPILERPKAA